MYKIESIDGKGKGAIASRDIEPGTRILREAAIMPIPEQDQQQLQTDDLMDADRISIVEAFKKMSKEKQKDVLQLADVHSQDLLYYGILNRQYLFGEFGQDNMKKDVAKIIGIANTNRFHNGIYLEMSRFNHSCGPNAEYFWNEHANARDLVATKRIKKDEEISVSYLLSDITIREERQSHLRQNYGCQICLLTGNELEEDERNRKQFRELQELDNQELDNLNLQHKLALKCQIKIMDVLQNTLDNAFEAACHAYFTNKNKSEVIKEYTEKGKEYATLLFGEAHPFTEMWKKRNEDPINEFWSSVVSLKSNISLPEVNSDHTSQASESWQQQEQPKMYKIESIDGKGKGAIASKDIEPGTCILRETASMPIRQLKSSSNKTVTEVFNRAAHFEAFKKMPLELQDHFLQLADVHSQDLVTEVLFQKQWELWEFGQDVTKEDVAKILGISRTNCFHNGIFFEMSRFNHSCGPNAEYFWNEHANARDLVAIKRIEKDEEISVSYLQSSEKNMREQRQSHLRQAYHFDCNCQICLLSGNDLEEDERNRKQLMELHTEYKSISSSSNYEELDNLNLQLKLALKCQVRIIDVLQNILDNAYEVACHTSFTNYGMEEVIEEYTEIGREYAILLFGEDHPITKMWQRRNRDPIGEFLLLPHVVV